MSAGVLGLTTPIPEFPWVGNSLPVAVLFTLHIAVAEYSAGAITLAPSVELWAARRGHPYGLRYARALANSYYLVFSLGATLAVFAVVLLTGLYGNETGRLFNVFFPLLAVAFGLFLVLTPQLVLYRNSFGRMRPGRHALLGFSVFFWQTLFIVCIVGVDTYLISPRDTGLFGAVTDAPYWPLLVHRLIGNVSWTALFLAAFAAIRLRRAGTEEERAFQGWAMRLNLRIGLITAVLMPAGGFVLVEALHSTSPGFVDNLLSSGAAWLFSVQELLLGLVFAGGNLALSLEPGVPPRWRTLGKAAAAVSAMGMVVGSLPQSVITGSVLWIRYTGLTIAAATTLVHVVARSLPQRVAESAPARPPRLHASVFTAVGTAALVVSLLMGYMKEHARGDYAVFGELTQDQAHGPYQPPAGTYP